MGSASSMGVTLRFLILANLAITIAVFQLSAEAVFWMRPGMNHIVACCDIISFNATELALDAKQRITSTNVTLKDTRVADLVDFRELSDPDTSASPSPLPAGAVVLPLVSYYNFHPHRWYNVCLATTTNRPKKEAFCFPARPGDCGARQTDAAESGGSAEAGGWLKIRLNVSVKAQKIYILLTSSFSSDNILRARYNVTLRSKVRQEVCVHLRPPLSSSTIGREEYEMRQRQCRREPPPLFAVHAPPNESIHVTQKDVNGLPFYVSISVGIIDSQRYFGRDIVLTLDPVKVTLVNNKNEDDRGDNDDGTAERRDGNFEHWINVPIPTPNDKINGKDDNEQTSSGVEQEWDEENSNRMCSMVHDRNCALTSTCNEAVTIRYSSFPYFTLPMSLLLFVLFPSYRCLL